MNIGDRVKVKNQCITGTIIAYDWGTKVIIIDDDSELFSFDDVIAALAESAFEQWLVLAAARAEQELGLTSGCDERIADGGFEPGDDEELGCKFAVVEQRQQSGVGLGNDQRHIGFVVAREFLGLHASFDRGLDDVFDFKQPLCRSACLTWCEGGIGRREILLMHAAIGEGRVLPGLIGGVCEDRR